MLIAEGLYYNTTAAALFEAMRVRRWVGGEGRRLQIEGATMSDGAPCLANPVTA